MKEATKSSADGSLAPSAGGSAPAVPAFRLTDVALRTCVVYALVAGLWILLSDRVVISLVSDPELIGRISTFKGWAFVVVTAFLLYGLLRSQLGHWEKENRKRQAVELELRLAQEKYRQIFEYAVEGTYQTTPQGSFLAANQAMARILGYASPAELIRERNDLGRQGYVNPLDREEFKRRIEAQGTISHFEYESRRKDGTSVWLEESARVVRDATGQVLYYEGSMRDVTEQKRAVEALRDSEARYRLVSENGSDVIWLFDLTANRFAYVSPSVEKLWGYTAEEVVQQNLQAALLPEDLRQTEGMVPARLAAFAAGEDAVRTRTEELLQRRKDGAVVPTEVVTTLVADAQRRVTHVRGVSRDITERRRAEAERTRLQEQLTHSQKMESVGRLAGGIAHDFNNMLTAIHGNVSLALADLPPASPVREHLDQIQQCAQRSAELTRQLLAFARKQTVLPQVLDLSTTVGGLLKMLRRLIGEDIELTWRPAASPCVVRLDPSQLDQILTNLCVNARDAISGVGKLTLETRSVSFDDSYCSTHVGAEPGDFVALAVSDSGCGMSKEVLDHLFEPFFTTKGVGQGTGLGLATVYGIVKQNGGFIEVESAPGKGTTFKVYLPRFSGHAALPAVGISAAPTDRGHETIMVVEDEPMILRVTKLVLESMGYRVLVAGTPGEAIRLAEEHAGEIHLLLTDVVMPEMNGRDLAKRLLTLYPNLRRVFMSGYTANVIAPHGVLEAGVHFVQKPFSREELANKVRAALDEGGEN